MKGHPPLLGISDPSSVGSGGRGGRLSCGEEEVGGGSVVCWIELSRAPFPRASPFLAKGMTL